MRRATWRAVLLLALGITAAQAADEQSFEQVERGRYLAILGDCAACHTAPGGKPYAGGLALQTPFGAIVTSNITPDRETGIGAWTGAQFYRALHEGIDADGAHLYPAMPYPAYTKLSRAETDALWAYMRTLQPVRQAVVSNRLPFPFNIRASLAVWNALNFSAGEFKPDPAQSPEWNRGAYIVQGPGHCGACHTPKNVLGGDRNDAFLQGAKLQGWFAPNITADPRIGVGGWAQDDIVEYLKTGANAHNLASGPMREEIAKSSSRWTDADLTAVAVYLKGARPPAAEAAQPLAADGSAMTAGGAIYEDRCSGCHKADGGGVGRLFPTLAKNPVVQQKDATTLIRVVLLGSQSGGTAAAPTTPAMPAFSRSLSDDQAAAVLTFIRNRWGNAAPEVAGSDVAAVRAAGAGG